MEKNIVLTGLMGTGKTTVGRLLAERLGRPFVDMDERLEAQAGKPIPRIFTEDGEDAFRQAEQALCVRLAETQGQVISTGGGALMDGPCRAAMLQNATVICLLADIDEIVRRVGKDAGDERPLLSVPDRREALERLWQARKAVYSQIPWQIDTSAAEVAEVAEQIAQIADMRSLAVHPPDEVYEIVIGRGLLKQTGNLIRRFGVPAESRVMVVTNDVVAPLYAEAVEKALAGAGYRSFRHVMKDGEEYKTLASLAEIYSACLEAGLGRRDTILALGGGVCGDVAGFAAASYMRGIRFIQVPTTLLAMVDSSVGGKTAVDLPEGKNLAGAFKQPAGVIIDPLVLGTLAGRELHAGMAEMIKHALIGDAGFFARLEEDPVEDWWQGDDVGDWLARTLDVKIKIVDEDPFEHGRRALLNCGHTIGHGVESVSGYSLKHGEAVSIGLVAETLLAEHCGIARAGLEQRLEALLRRWQLPTRIPAYPAADIWRVMGFDKKKQDQTLRFALADAIGSAGIVDSIPPEAVQSVLSEMGAG